MQGDKAVIEHESVNFLFICLRLRKNLAAIDVIIRERHYSSGDPWVFENMAYPHEYYAKAYHKLLLIRLSAGWITGCNEIHYPDRYDPGG
jgi:hypothetical protein